MVSTRRNKTRRGGRRNNSNNRTLQRQTAKRSLLNKSSPVTVLKRFNNVANNKFSNKTLNKNVSKRAFLPTTVRR
jgi:hypothetical protein